MEALLEAIRASEVTGVGREDGDAEDRWIISELMKPVLQLLIFIHFVIHHDAQLPELVESIDLILVQWGLFPRLFHRLLQPFIYYDPGIGESIEDEKFTLLGKRRDEYIEV
jgi:hypothetical protein